MLKQRIATAAVLLALLLPALLASNPWPFAVLTLVMLAAAGWEWGRLNAGGALGSLALGAALAAACAAALGAGWAAAPPALGWTLAVAFWVVGGGMALAHGPAGWPRAPRSLRLALGFVALWAAWLALAQAHALGLNFLLSVFCVVWMADIAAYFGGRAFGRRKLAPSISPGKSWEGVYSGLVGVLLLALAWLQVEQALQVQAPSLFSLLLAQLGWAGAALALLGVAAMSVVGDLVESLVKRAAGAKDSSRLLPGHGGVLDRIDALLPVFPIALALAAL
jgi:phosphatidate cytidylyltransferase